MTETFSMVVVGALIQTGAIVLLLFGHPGEACGVASIGAAIAWMLFAREFWRNK